MVREKNVKLMSRIAIYEKRKGKTEIPMNGFYKSDYARIHALKAAVSATVAFVLVAAMVVIYKLDYILANVFKLDYKKIGIYVAAGYVAWVLLYWIIAWFIYSKKYEDARPNIIIYNHNLKKLREESERDVIKSKGGVVLDDDFINL